MLHVYNKLSNTEQVKNNNNNKKNCKPTAHNNRPIVYFVTLNFKLTCIARQSGSSASTSAVSW